MSLETRASRSSLSAQLFLYYTRKFFGGAESECCHWIDCRLISELNNGMHVSPLWRWFTKRKQFITLSRDNIATHEALVSSVRTRLVKTDGIWIFRSCAQPTLAVIYSTVKRRISNAVCSSRAIVSSDRLILVNVRGFCFRWRSAIFERSYPETRIFHVHHHTSHSIVDEFWQMAMPSKWRNLIMTRCSTASCLYILYLISVQCALWPFLHCKIENLFQRNRYLVLNVRRLVRKWDRFDQIQW